MQHDLNAIELRAGIANALGLPRGCTRAVLTLDSDDVPRIECEILPHLVDIDEHKGTIDAEALAAVPYIVRLEMRPPGVPLEPGSGEYRVRFYATGGARPAWRWAMFGRNGTLVAMSPQEGYTRKSAAVRAIEGILGGAVEIVEATSPFPFGVGDR